MLRHARFQRRVALALLANLLLEVCLVPHQQLAALARRGELGLDGGEALRGLPQLLRDRALCVLHGSLMGIPVERYSLLQLPVPLRGLGLGVLQRRADSVLVALLQLQLVLQRGLRCHERVAVALGLRERRAQLFEVLALRVQAALGLRHALLALADLALELGHAHADRMHPGVRILPGLHRCLFHIANLLPRVLELLLEPVARGDSVLQQRVLLLQLALRHLVGRGARLAFRLQRLLHLLRLQPVRHARALGLLPRLLEVLLEPVGVLLQPRAPLLGLGQALAQALRLGPQRLLHARVLRGGLALVLRQRRQPRLEAPPLLADLGFGVRCSVHLRARITSHDHQLCLERLRVQRLLRGEARRRGGALAL
mmetsp:Transcript_63423/g.163194  ORF Transcript_63423/g.163194 Transcript_63423/m.163194 type:complete len:370 (-) Transcript_63423:1095-2204(-)